MKWVLIISLYASGIDHVALTNVKGFITKEACIKAGKKSSSDLETNVSKSSKFSCVNLMGDE